MMKLIVEYDKGLQQGHAPMPSTSTLSADGLMTIDQIAAECGVPFYTINYVCKRDHIEPTARVRHCRLFDRATAALIHSKRGARKRPA